MSCYQKFSFYAVLILLISLNQISSFPEDPCNEDNKGQYVAYPERCNAYYGCLMNQWFLFECPMGLEFNPLKQVCDRPISGGCALWTSTTTEATTEMSTTESPGTTEEATSEVPTSTSTYVETTTVESSTEVPTTTSTLMETTTVESTEEVPTKTSTIVETTSTESETETEISTTDESTSQPELTTTGSGNVCSDKPPNTFIPHPEDCAQFYYCENGNPLPFKCGVGLLFDAKLLKCVLGGEAECFS